MLLLARAVSILGHPLLVLPVTVMVLLAHRDPRWMLPVMLGFAGFAGLVMGYSWWQVRRENWAHVDASDRRERSSLNRFLLAAMIAGAVIAWTSGPRALALGLALSAGLVALGMLTARWWKLSLHVGFATYAACLLRPIGGWAVVAGLGFAAAVAWSRLALARHVPRDVIAGAIAGGGMGAIYWLVATRLT